MEIKEYMAIIFDCQEDLIHLIDKISEHEVRQMIIGDEMVIVTFSTSLLINELNDLFETNNENNYFILFKADEDNIKMNLHEGVEDFFKRKNSIIDLIGNPDFNTIEKANKKKLMEAPHELLEETVNPDDFIEILDISERISLKEELLDKLPNISNWEKLILKKLVNE